MKVGIIGAMEEEVTILKNQLQNARHTVIAGYEFSEGTLGGREVILVKSGIGKVNAAVATTLLLQLFKPDAVLNTGSAGGIGENLEVGTVVLSSDVTHHDVDVTAFGYALGQVPGGPVTYVADEKLLQVASTAVEDIGKHAHASGLIASGDVFMSDPSRVMSVKQQFPELIAAEMEAAAVAQVCHEFKVPFVVIRALSDIAGKESSLSFDEFLPAAAQHSSEVVLQVISKL
ncbi:5'-methylthioadenosine/S-adenosylhomocysteine nucleosidase [Sporosarcina gallistercoris]|uniref:5'-methylthioadenosine/S-adenosylhomocysteine nucleosidase n=1 Tax=Sporosarcina gallistercoris TaxID=2762245 RepID=A0ABR8PFF5_9BACL|nr:5'-methylthioadenosine/S-adenosylhomocysteine nucleosidase [Sporosarcina gallistercoris]MBD7906892.1 5'-methylthioadenosine/S-adenosylhomocysteine nucleosidase [Sporosarcina gallistercoris]